jgi:hypothetical protein
MEDTFMGAGKFKGSGGKKFGINNRDLDHTGDKQLSLFDEEGQHIMNHVNPFSDKKTWPSKLEEGQQGKHIEDHPNYQPGRSKLTVSMTEASQLTETFSGTGAVVGNPDNSNKERVDFGKNIGMYKDPEKGFVPTTSGIIHHSKKGAHIVPARPN